MGAESESADFTQADERIDVHCARKHDDKIVVLHLSDLHFSSACKGTDARFSAIRSGISATNIRPDIIVVTGDIADSPVSDALRVSAEDWGTIADRARLLATFFSSSAWKVNLRRALSSACSFLEELCADQQLDPAERLFVIPGNHDLGISGIFRPKNVGAFAREIFREVFGPYWRDLHLNFTERKEQRIAATRLIMCCLDSNADSTRLNFAAGKVALPELQRAQASARATDTVPTFRIALLHHHPAPIAAAEVNDALEDERFHMLLNSGSVIQALIDSGYDLVLHGHRHVRGSSRITLPSRSESSLAISSAGSASVRNGGYYMSTIEITSSGDVWCKHVERHENTPFKVDAAAPVLLVPYAHRRKNLIRSALDAPNSTIVLRARRVVHVTRIDSAGNSSRKMMFYGLQPRETCRELPFVVAVQNANGSGQQPIATHVGWRGQMHCVRKEHGSSAAKWSFVFEPALSADDRVDLTIAYDIPNCHSLWADKTAETVRGYSYFRSDEIQIGRLIRILELPEAFADRDNQFEVRVQRGREREFDETAEWRFVREGMVEGADRRSAYLVVEDPIPDVAYNLSWSLLPPNAADT